MSEVNPPARAAAVSFTEDQGFVYDVYNASELVDVDAVKRSAG